MANVYAAGRYIIDTAGSTLLRSTLSPSLNPGMRIAGIRWVGATTAGHTAVIQDVNSVTLWASVANAANYVEESLAAPLLWTDFKVTTLASGILYIFLKDGA